MWKHQNSDAHTHTSVLRVVSYGEGKKKREREKERKSEKKKKKLETKFETKFLSQC